jgi:hypothetical protein
MMYNKKCKKIYECVVCLISSLRLIIATATQLLNSFATLHSSVFREKVTGNCVVYLDVDAASFSALRPGLV